jgi:L,D-peptidoglycan transpeptidase YkuD (ErfK/YbiS/YcfS/YnhG family)
LLGRPGGTRTAVRLLRASMLVFALLAARARADTLTTVEKPVSPIPSASRQLLLVRSPSWSAASGTLEQYERVVDGPWSLVGTRIAVSLGRHGMAWGRGQHSPPDQGPFKKEGDGRSPAGVFALDRAFGAADALPDGARGFPYLHALPSSYCVEDVRSDLYNQLIDARDVTARAWEKWSELRRSDGLFDWAIVVRQNDPDVRRGGGSCVFLHIWRGPHFPTAGCTAMAREHVEAIVRWLEPGAHPMLVQLPDPELAGRRDRWDLPG